MTSMRALFVLLIAASSAVAHAQPPAAAEPQVAIVTDAHDRGGALGRAIEALVSRIETVVLDRRERVDRPGVQREARESPMRIGVWVGVAGTTATVWIVDARRQRVLERNVDLAEGGAIDLVVQEEIAQIAYSAVSGMLSGEAIGTELPEFFATPRPEPVALPEAPPPPRVLALAGRYAAALRDGDHVAHALALGARFRDHANAPISLAAFALVRAPSAYEGSEVGFETVEGAIRGEVAIATTSDALRFSGGLSATVGAEWVVSRVSASGLAAVDSPASAVLRFGLFAMGSVRIADFAELSLGLEAEVDPLDRIYVVSGGENDEIVGDPWIVSPGAFVELAMR